MAIPPLRVAVVARAAAPLHGAGGLERSVGDLVRHLAAREVQVTLITPPPTSVMPSGSDPFGSPFIELRQVPYLTFPFANRRGTTVIDRSTAYLLYGERAGRLAGDLVSSGEADIVHGFGASVLGYARRRPPRQAPLVLNPQGLEEFGATLESPPFLKNLGYAPLRWAVRRCARAADCIISTDAALDTTVQRHLHPRPGQMRTIPNAIDLAHVTSLAGPAEGAILRQRMGIGADEFVLLSAGRLEHNKGLDVLAEALRRLSQPGEPLAAIAWRWVVVGGGPFRPAIERAAEQAGIGARVMMAGAAADPDLHAWYEAATLFVHPTRYEGSSLVTLEAMAHRRPVVASRAGGLPDKIRSGHNGWLAEPGDADSLAAALRDAISARTRLAEMGARGRVIVEDEFSWSTIVDRQIGVYRELLDAFEPSRRL
ncbi:MAG TPA: glycosyltransferase family 4 protein [Vicinamibacterales bacterium]|nr:glycosyltransferase family 4 protein [Vicinamibacterales bacterium]